MRTKLVGRRRTVITRNTLVRFAMVAVGGLAVGIATSYLQGVLPGASNTLANTGAVWSALGFGLVVAAALRGWPASVAGGIALLGEVVGYYLIASPLRGFPSTTFERVLWVAAALVIGPVVGWAAGWWATDRPWRRLAAVAMMAGIVVGEGLHGLLRIEGGGPQWWLEVVVGSAVGAIALIRYGQTAPPRLSGGLGILAVAFLIFIAYGLAPSVARSIR